MLLSSGWYRTLLVLAALPAVGQNSAVDIAGTWQGMLAGGPKEQRTVYKISRADSGAFQAVFYSLIKADGRSAPVPSACKARRSRS